MGHAAQGGRIAAPIRKQRAQTALKDQPKVPFVAPPGIRWVRIDRATGKRVYGVFPTSEDPKSPVIWEAFQPQTEPRRGYRSGAEDLNADNGEGEQQAAAQPSRRRAPAHAAQDAPPPVATLPQPAGLPTQNAL
jgi:penicillin-binding protein 1A